MGDIKINMDLGSDADTYEIIEKLLKEKHRALIWLKKS